jgi:hypothetical protein
MINNAASSLRQDSEGSAVIKEITGYLLKTRNASAYSAKNAALTFWKIHEGDYPQLAALARVFLAVNAGSVPVECLFSTTGLIMNSKRCSLSPYKMNMITFVHDNYKYM